MGLGESGQVCKLRLEKEPNKGKLGNKGILDRKQPQAKREYVHIGRE